MKDFLKKFQTTVNYNTWKSSENYIEPNVSYITENGGGALNIQH